MKKTKEQAEREFVMSFKRRHGCRPPQRLIEAKLKQWGYTTALRHLPFPSVNRKELTLDKMLENSKEE